MNLSEWCIASAGRQFKAFYANAHRGKLRKAGLVPLALRMAEEELRPVASNGWAAIIRIRIEARILSTQILKKSGKRTGVPILLAWLLGHFRRFP